MSGLEKRPGKCASPPKKSVFVYLLAILQTTLKKQTVLYRTFFGSKRCHTSYGTLLGSI